MSNKLSHDEYLQNKPLNDRYRGNQESQRSMDYTSIESDGNESVVKFNTISASNQRTA